jgi:hypothetical protein
MTEALTEMQRKILKAMADGQPTAFTGDGARKHGFGKFPAKAGGHVIRAYQDPQYFMARRGLIEIIRDRDVPGAWYRITPKGHDALKAALKAGSTK